MKKLTAPLAAIVLGAFLLLTASGCAAKTAAAETVPAETTIAETTAAETTAAELSASAGTAQTAQETAEAVVAAAPVTNGLIDASGLFTDRDLTQTPDLSDAVYETVSDGADITITEAGVYVLSGTARECTVVVDAQAEDAKVQLVLDGVSLTNTDAPAIYVVSADKCFITTTDSDNTLTVTGSFTADGDVNTDAVVFSRADLVLNGVGTLTIASSANGVSAKDKLKITGGTYDITASGNGIEANDALAVCGGTFSLNVGRDALQCGTSDDDTLGSVYISGGSFVIAAGDDGIQGATIVEIDGGEFAIDSAEGVEGTYIQINAGTLSLNASDDGINAAAKSTAYDVVVELNGGTITIVMGSGDTDAVDANGSIYVNGGSIDITGGSSFDYDVSGQLNGGTVIVNGVQITEMPAQMGGMGGMGGRGNHG